ncbi:cellulose binding domain-containing protein [Kitasatospora sp. NBC_01287]|uniref:cellulose binding domain-containing protein n=1 Tax=Kitasatospora sp. NBC_01287 TaxID=2903573 RepID=UPI00225010CD|nr:cellulose binding domain-containing protein [Kitasatospora sp. NBC_01287]MCX4744723.1 cellulose binding domain-containing protein [Kitasatospora sp. NBC_01287]
MSLPPPSSRLRLPAALAGLALLAAGPLWSTTPNAGAATSATTAATVSVNAAQSLATVPATAIGTNGSVYDSKLADAAVPGLLKQAGVGLVRFPGGSSSDSYDWKTNSDLTNGTQAVDFDQYATMLQQSGAQGMVTVNYGSGDVVGATESPAETGAQLAADWVRYANVTHNYRIKYWEIGNEVYGNGTYGGSWETDKHCAAGASPSNCGPAVYARNAEAYIAAMKAVDPTIQVGVVLTAPGNWPDGSTSAGSPQPWNQTVMTTLAGQIGFADVHWYPQNPSSVTPPGPTDSGLLAAPAQIPAMIGTLRSQLDQYADSGSVPIMITETNSVSSNPGKQTVGLVNALFLPQDYLGWLTNGAAGVDWWQIHNGIVTSGDNGSALYGSAAYGDYGMLADGSCGTAGGAQLCEPAADTPFPAYNGMTLLGRFVHPGDTLVRASSNQSLVKAYSVKAADGSLRVLLVNDDPANSYQVGLDYAGFTPAPGTPAVTTMAGASAALTTAGTGTAASQTVAPYSAVLLTLQPGSAATPPTTPGTPTSSGVTSTSVNLSWAPSSSSTGLAGYDVVRVQGGTETAVASPTGAGATVDGLLPGTAYTFAVYARDTAGNRSARSGTVTVTTAAATGGSSCEVGYSVNDWGGGFTATLVLTNTGSAPVSGWTLSFDWPGDQRLSSGWNANWTQSGSTVTATSLSYNATLAPGASTSVGFNASYSGGNPAPSGFTLNGTPCG